MPQRLHRAQRGSHDSTPQGAGAAGRLVLCSGGSAACDQSRRRARRAPAPQRSAVDPGSLCGAGFNCCGSSSLPAAHCVRAWVRTRVGLHRGTLSQAHPSRNPHPHRHTSANLWQGGKGYRPLHWCAAHDSFKVAALLLQQGADSTLPNLDRETAYYVAYKCKHERVMAAIRVSQLSKSVVACRRPPPPWYSHHAVLLSPASSLCILQHCCCRHSARACTKAGRGLLSARAGSSARSSLLTTRRVLPQPLEAALP